MLRWMMLKLSQSTQMKNLLMRFSSFRKAKERFVAGETLDELVTVVKRLNSSGMKTSVDYLGENVSSPEQAAMNKAMYFSLLDRIRHEHLDSHVSVKLTALGLDINEHICAQNLEDIVAKVRDTGSFVRIDMENSPYTERTLQAYRTVRRKYSHVGAVIQSSLYRSQQDVMGLIKEDIANIRLCKGAYLEAKTIAFPQKKDVDQNYLVLAKLLAESTYTNDVYPAYATHDEKMITSIKNHTKKIGLPLQWFEFQMLYGIRPDLQKQLMDEGYIVRVYVPFGKDWYGYFCRRLAERPANVWFVMKNLFR